LNKARDKNFEKYRNSILKGKILIKTAFKIGDRVCIFRENNSNKLKEKWKRGYVVIGLISEDAVAVKKEATGKRMRVDKTYIKHYNV
jgi:hypothetical protein